MAFIRRTLAPALATALIGLTPAAGRAQIRNPGDAVGNLPGAINDYAERLNSARALRDLGSAYERERAKLPAGVCREYELTQIPGGPYGPMRYDLSPVELPGQALTRPSGSSIDPDSPRGRWIADNPPQRIGRPQICGLTPGVGFTTTAPPDRSPATAPAVPAGTTPRAPETRTTSANVPPSRLVSPKPPTSPSASPSLLGPGLRGPYDAGRYNLGVDYSSLGRGLDDLAKKYPWLTR
jgi:hypothetical protein